MRQMRHVEQAQGEMPPSPLQGLEEIAGCVVKSLGLPSV